MTSTLSRHKQRCEFKTNSSIFSATPLNYYYLFPRQTEETRFNCLDQKEIKKKDPVLVVVH